MTEKLFDDLARTLAAPMGRRRAMRLLGAAFAVAAVPGLRPRTAHARPLDSCGRPSCAGCGPTVCGKDTNPGCNIGCYLGNGLTVCCPHNPNTEKTSSGAPIGSWCCQTGCTCGSGGNTASDPNCKCPTPCADRYRCGDSCCKNGEYCEKNFWGADFCEKICPTGHDKCIGVCCTENETCGFFGCGCKSGLVSTGAGTCVEPKEDPGDPKPGNNPFRNLFNMMGQSSAAHGGGRRQELFVRPARSGSAGVGEALDALAAVNGQGAAAMFAIRYGHRDPAFKQKVIVSRATPPTLSAGAGLDAGSVAALNKLLVAEARAHALIAAMAKALWRARAAHAKHDQAAAKNQLRASAAFAGQAVTALKGIQALRTGAANALTVGGIAEVLASTAEVTAFIASVRSPGIPGTLRTPMGKLGVGSADLERVRARVVDQKGAAAAGPVLIAPLQDSARASELKSLISELSKFSTRAQKHPIAR